MNYIFKTANGKHYSRLAHHAFDHTDPVNPLVLVKRFDVMGPNNFAIKIPRGFRYDGGSVPRFLWWFLNPYSPIWMIAFLVHDYLYRRTGDSRLLADIRLREIAIQCGAKPWRAWIVFRVLRLTGGIAWRENHRKSKGFTAH